MSDIMPDAMLKTMQTKRQEKKPDQMYVREMPENTPEKCKKHLERISRKTLQIMPETNLRNHEASKKKNVILISGGIGFKSNSALKRHSFR